MMKTLKAQLEKLKKDKTFVTVGLTDCKYLYYSGYITGFAKCKYAGDVLVLLKDYEADYKHTLNIANIKNLTFTETVTKSFDDQGKLKG